MMKICVTGGTGFVGTRLTQRLLSHGHEVTIVSSRGRSTVKHTSLLHTLKADTTREGEWQKEMGSFDVIVNLTGRTIFNYWTESYKEKIYSSRVDTTKNIVKALPDKTQVVLLNTSAAGYYGDSGDVEQVEDNPSGQDFLATVCEDWEKAAMAAKEKGARVATMRFGVVLGKGGGAIETMKTPFKLGLGGPIGDGSQWFPWIHVDDLVSAILFLINTEVLEGPFNFTAPAQVRQKEFARELAKSLSRPAFMPAPSFMMKTVLGDFGKSLLLGQKVVPKRLQENGFVFHYPQLQDALEEILHG